MRPEIRSIEPKEDTIVSVVKNKRKASRFEAIHQFIALRQSITDLVIHDFGFSESKYRKMIEWKLTQIEDQEKADRKKSEWEIKNESFKTFFVDQEAIAILDLLRKISTEFNVGNAIYPADTPAKLFEYIARRWHMSNAIGYCYALKDEIQYVIRTLPVDINRYIPFAEEIDKQILLFKGVRLADNRFLRPGKGEKHRAFGDVLSKTIAGITNIVHRIMSYEQVNGFAPTEEEAEALVKKETKKKKLENL